LSRLAGRGGGLPDFDAEPFTNTPFSATAILPREHSYQLLRAAQASDGCRLLEGYHQPIWFRAAADGNSGEVELVQALLHLAEVLNAMNLTGQNAGLERLDEE
jgi:hypothetical protein